MDQIIYTEQQERQEAIRLANDFTLKEQKLKAYINSLGAMLVTKYIAQEGINVEGISNMHRIRRVREEFDIADIMLPNIHIDVRTVYDEATIFIPKSHFEYNLKPDIYVVLSASHDTSYMKFMGFFEPVLINAKNQNSDYYFVKKEQLIRPSHLKSYIQDFDGNTTQTLDESELESGQNLLMSFIDHDISENNKRRLFNLLVKSALLREKAIEFENFETVSYSAMGHEEIRREQVKPIEKPVDEFEVFEKESVFDEKIEDAITDENSENEQIQDENQQFADDNQDTSSENEEFENEAEQNQEELSDNENNTPDDIEKDDKVQNIEENNDVVIPVITPAFSANLGQLVQGTVEDMLTSDKHDETSDVNFDENIEQATNEEDKVENIEQSEETPELDELEEMTLSEVAEDVEDENIQESINEENEIVGEKEETIELENLEELTSGKELEEVEDENIQEIINEEDETIEENEKTIELDDELIDESIMNTSIDDLIVDANELTLDEQMIPTLDVSEESEDAGLIIDSQDEQNNEENEELSEFAEIQDLTSDVADENIEEMVNEEINSIEENEETSEIENLEELTSGEELEEVKDEAIEESEEVSQFANLEELSSGEEIDVVNNETIEEYIQENNEENTNEIVNTDALDELQELISEDSVKSDEQLEEEVESVEVKEESDLDRLEDLTFENGIEETVNNEESIQFNENQEQIEVVNEVSEENKEEQGQSDLSEDEPVQNVEDEVQQNEEVEQQVNEESAEPQSEEEIEEGTQLVEATNPEQQSEEGLAVLYNEENKPDEDIKLNNIEIGRKSIIIASSIVFGLVALLLFINILKANKQVNDEIVVENNLPTVEDALPAADNALPSDSNKQNNILESVDTVQPVKKNEIQQPKINPASRQINDSPYLEVKKLGWSVPDYLVYNSAFQRYIQSVSKSLKLAISSDLLLATEYSYSDKIELNITITKQGEIKDVSMLTSSGSTQIDEIIKKSVKSTLEVMKSPTDSFVGDSIRMILIVNL